MKTPGHISFTYLGNGLTSVSPPDAVVAYEPVSLKKWAILILFVDGRVGLFEKPVADMVISKAGAGLSPIEIPGAP
jgi:hypothetical protein